MGQMRCYYAWYLQDRFEHCRNYAGIWGRRQIQGHHLAFPAAQLWLWLRLWLISSHSC
jgi:hypothetical protein